MNNISLRFRWKHLIIILLVIHLAPLWLFKYFPSQDGPSHIYNAHVLKEYHKHENYKLRDVFKLNLTLFPNWTSHPIMAALLYVFPPLVTEKILLSLCVGLFPLSMLYFLNAVNKRNVLFGLLGFLFAYNYLLHMGFYNFAISVPLFFFTLGYWWKHKHDITTVNVIVLYVLSLLTYLSHIASYGLLLLVMLILACTSWISEAVVAIWSKRKNNMGLLSILKTSGNQLSPLLKFGGYMLPLYFILLGYYLSSPKESGNSHQSAQWIKEYFWGVKSLVSFTDWHIPVMRVLLGLLALAILLTIVQRILKRQWLSAHDPFLLLAILFTIMFIKAPWGLGPGGWINDRIHLYIFLLLTPWFALVLHRYTRYVFTAGLILLSCVHLGITCYEYHLINPEIKELASGVDKMTPHSTYSTRSPNWHESDALGTIKYVTPFGHAVCYYGLYKKDIGHLANYEANYNYFPINFNGSYEGITDYILAWHYPQDSPELKSLEETYDIVHDTKNLKLFRLKQATGPDLSLWDDTPEEKLIIRFDMQPDNGQTAPGYKAINMNTGYVSGRYGWVTKSPSNVLQGPGEISEPYRDAVWDTADAAFKLDLPSGVYRVTCYFSSGEGAAHQINLLANDKQVIKRLIVPPGNDTIERSYTVTVTDGYLTQVIYTTQKRTRDGSMHEHWIWNGFIVTGEWIEACSLTLVN